MPQTKKKPQPVDPLAPLRAIITAANQAKAAQRQQAPKPTPKPAPKPAAPIPAPKRMAALLQQAWDDKLVDRYQQETLKGGSEAHRELAQRAKEAGLDPRAVETNLQRSIKQQSQAWSKKLPLRKKTLFDTIAGIPIQFGMDITTAAVHSPAGLYQIGKAGALDVRDTAQGHPTLKRTAAIGEAMAKGVAQDVQHPLRHPGFTLLDALAAISMGAGAAGRGLAATRAVGAETGALSKAGAAAKALARKPVPAARTITSKGVTVHPAESWNVATNLVQQGYDKLLSAFPESWPTQTRVSKELWHEQRHAENVAQALPNAVKTVGAKLSEGQQRALQVVAEGQPIETRIAALKQERAAATDRTTAASQDAELRTLAKARPYVETVDGKPVLKANFDRSLRDRLRRKGVKPEQLSEAYALMGKASGRSSEVAVSEGLLKPETVAQRKHLPGRVIAGEDKTVGIREPTPAIEGQQALFGPQFKGGEVYVPHTRRGRLQRAVAGVRGYRLGVPPKPTATAHELTGALMRRGDLSTNTMGAVATGTSRMEQYATKTALRDRLDPVSETFSQDTWRALSPKERQGYQPMRTSSAARLPDSVKNAMEKQDAGQALTSAEERAVAEWDREAGKDMFPRLADLKTAEDFKGVVFVPKRYIRHVTSQGSALGRSIGHQNVRRALSVFKATNQLERLGILFTGPKYIVANLPQNFAMTVVEQGPAKASRNYVWAVKQAKDVLSPEAYAKAVSAVGEGVAQSGLGGAGQVLGKVTGWTARKYGKVTDLHARLSSLKYAAAKLGYNTDAKFEQLLMDPAKAQDLYRAARKATDAIGDYQRLGALEKEIRDVVFFYPWLKVGSRWSKHFVAEHPVQAAGVAQAGAIGKEQTRKDLGPLPGFLEGTFQVGTRGKNPLVVNPTNIGVLNTPVGIAQALAGQSDQSLVQNLTPAASALMALVTRQNSFGQDYPSAGPGVGGFLRQSADILKDQLVTNLPPVTAVERIRGKRTSKLYPLSKRDAALQFAAGGWFPKPLDQTAANEMAAEEQKAGRSRTQKAQSRSEAELRSIATAAHLAGVKGLTPELQHALKNRARQRLALAEARDQAKPEDLTKNGDLTLRAKLAAEVNLLVQAHATRDDGSLITQADAAKFVAWAEKATDKEVAASRRQIARVYFEADRARAATKWLRDHGYHVTLQG